MVADGFAVADYPPSSFAIDGRGTACVFGKNKPYRIEKNARGELEIMTPVGYRGGRIELFVARELDIWAEADGRGEASGPNTGFNLSDGSTLSPDAAWVSHEQLAPLTQEQRATYPPFCPQFVLEVRPESDRLPVLQAKMQTWLHNGAQLAWLVDPYAATLTVYRPGRALKCCFAQVL